MSDDPVINVLLIEDNQAQADLVLKMFERTSHINFKPVHMSTLTDGLKRLSEGNIDVVVTDLALPDSYGLDTYTRLQTQDPDVPIVLLTNIDDEVVAVRSIETGAQDYLIKARLNSLTLVRGIRFAIERGKISAEMRRRYQKKIADLRSLAK